MKNTLHLKRTLRSAILVLLLSVVGMTNVFADGFDYAEVCPSGQTLYYKIDPDDPNGVIVVPPYYHYFSGYEPPVFEAWGGYEKPVGDVIIPESLSNGMIVKGIGKFCIFNSSYSEYPIHVGAFQHCEEITSVIIPNSVTYIDDGAFSGCTSLNSVSIGNSVTRIGYAYDSDTFDPFEYPGGAFSGCPNLSSIEIGNAVEFIGYGAFSGCSGLTSVTFPNSLTAIGESAFRGCSSLASITIPNSVTKIGSRAFEETEWYNEQNDGILYLSHWCMGLKGEVSLEGAFVIQEGVRGIADGVFYDQGMTSVVLPQSLACIGEYAFSYCLGLTSVTIPKSVAYIGRGAFKECYGLTMVFYNAQNATTNGSVFNRCYALASLNVGSDVRNIDGNMFKSCNTVHLVAALGSTPAVLGSGAFSELADDAMLMVPCGKKMTYFSQWNMFPYDNVIENCDQNPVSMAGVGAGGNITPSTTHAQMGEEVLLTVRPNEGMALASISIGNASEPTQTIPYYFPGKGSNTIGFIMPQFAVTVTATFHVSGAAVGEVGDIAVSVYPNPSSGIVRVEAENLRSVGVFNALGQQVYDIPTGGNEFEIDLGDHEPGIYLIRIETASGMTTKRVVLTK